MISIGTIFHTVVVAYEALPTIHWWKKCSLPSLIFDSHLTQVPCYCQRIVLYITALEVVVVGLEESDYPYSKSKLTNDLAYTVQYGSSGTLFPGQVYTNRSKC